VEEPNDGSGWRLAGVSANYLGLRGYGERPPVHPPVQAFPTPALRQEREGRGTHFVGDASEVKTWVTRLASIEDGPAPRSESAEIGWPS
jgi:hypothetical protein